MRDYVDAPVRIENRAQLIYLLTEAAELEHGIMCCYLFAAFSLKKDVSEGVAEEQLAFVRRWRGVILQIAIQEMVHMALACNILTAVGGAPHIRRPNLPSSPRAYPPSFQLGLAPFSHELLESFIFLERPEAEEQVDPQAPIQSLGKFSDIFSSERQYQTVGHLYRGIEDGLSYLTQKYGEDQLFVGPPDSQIAETYFSLPGLFPVKDLATALAAIEGIVAQGEGARGDREDSHHGRFLAIREEYDRILQDDPSFVPARPVMANPYTMLPHDLGDKPGVNLLEDPMSVDISNLFDGCYELLMQMLGRLLLHIQESESQLIKLADVSVDMMIDVIGPLGEVITALPAGTSHPGLTAGPSFRFSRDLNILPHQAAAWTIFIERFKELSAYCGFLQAEGELGQVLTRVRGALSLYADKLQES